MVQYQFTPDMDLAYSSSLGRKWNMEWHYFFFCTNVCIVQIRASNLYNTYSKYYQVVSNIGPRYKFIHIHVLKSLFFPFSYFHSYENTEIISFEEREFVMHAQNHRTIFGNSNMRRKSLCSLLDSEAVERIKAIAPTLLCVLGNTLEYYFSVLELCLMHCMNSFSDWYLQLLLSSNRQSWYLVYDVIHMISLLAISVKVLQAFLPPTLEKVELPWSLLMAEWMGKQGSALLF